MGILCTSLHPYRIYAPAFIHAHAVIIILLSALFLTGADLIVGATIPIVAYTTLQGTWVFSEPLCTLMGFVHMLTFIASVMSLAAISVNRYVSVCHPWQLRTWYTPRRTALWIAGESVLR